MSNLINVDQVLNDVNRIMLQVDAKLGTSTLRDTVGEIFENTDLTEDQKLYQITRSVAKQLKEKILTLETISMTLQPVVQFVLHLATQNLEQLCQMILEQLKNQMFGFFSMKMYFAGRQTRFEMIRSAIYLLCGKSNNALHLIAAKKDDHSQQTLCHIMDLIWDCNVIDMLDDDGKTCLYVAVENGALKNALTILSYGADPNIGMRGSSERTPLRAAATLGDLDLVRLLLLYDAQIDCVEGMDCPEPVQDCINIIREYKKWMENISKGERVKLQWNNDDVINALSIDGGGVRGLASAQILIEIDSMFGSEVIESFTWTAGTSTGSILSLALSLGKNPAQCRNIYLRLKDKVFQKTYLRKFLPLLVNYDNRPLEQFLKIEFGRYTKMNSIKHKRVMVASCNFDKQPIQPVLFRNYVSDNLPYAAEPWQAPEKILIWLAARCSSAAPYYFNYVEHFSSAGRLMDGGLVANNPTRLLLLDLDEEMKTSGKKLGCVLSLGTGHCRTINVESRIKRPLWLRNMVELIRIKDVILDRATDSNTLCLTDQRTTWHMEGKYFRFSPELDHDVDLDETDDSKIIELMWNTKMYVYKSRDELGRLYRYLCGMQTDHGLPLERVESYHHIQDCLKSGDSPAYKSVRPRFFAKLQNTTPSVPFSDLNDFAAGAVYRLQCDCGAVFVGETKGDIVGEVTEKFRLNRQPHESTDPIARHRRAEHADTPSFLEVIIIKDDVTSSEQRQQLVQTELGKLVGSNIKVMN